MVPGREAQRVGELPRPPRPWRPAEPGRAHLDREDGEEHIYTYARLYRVLNRFANALRRLGVGKGDRVVVYMPLVPEGIITVLACARIGAVHSVVYAGMGTQALSSRIADSDARVVVCTPRATSR